MGNGIGGNCVVYLAGNGHKCDCSKLHIVDETLPAQLREAGISDQAWATFVQSANHILATRAMNPWYFFGPFIVFMMFAPAMLIKLLIDTGFFGYVFREFGGLAFVLIYLIFMFSVIIPIGIFIFYGQKRRARIVAEIQPCCDKMCAASGAVIVSGFFGGNKHAQACLWFQVTSARGEGLGV